MEHQGPLTPDELAAKLAAVSIQAQELREDNDTLRQENDQLREENAQLREQLDRLQRAMDDLRGQAFRQAAPFRVPDERRKQEKKKPGRKKGHKADYRPVPDHVDEHIHVALERCPRCGGTVQQVRPVEQYIEDIPPIKVHVTKLVTEVGRCRRCGEVRSRHPLQMSLGQGCAKVQLGPRVLGIAAQIKEHLGVSFRKTSSLLHELFGLRVTAGGLSHALGRVAHRLNDLYGQMAESIRAGPLVHADETSWWVGEAGWWLWVFARPDLTVYDVDRSRGARVVERMLGDQFAGVLVSDCLASYDPIRCTKQKCYAHHLRALCAAIDQTDPAHARPLRDLKTLLMLAMQIDKQRAQMSREAFGNLAERIRHGVNEILHALHPGPGVEKILNRFRKQREHLFTFLDHPGVPPDNNLAERQLRPAVIARKLSCGNRTVSGKARWQVLCSIAATCQQRAASFIDLIVRSMPLLAPTPQLEHIQG